MWKSRPDEKPASSSSVPVSQPVNPSPAAPSVAGANRENRSLELGKTSDPFRADVAAHIGKSVLVKGQLSGSEDLYLDGEVEGTIELREHTLVVGPNGRIRAGIVAREVILHGKVEGNIEGTERVELKKSCSLTGNVATQRVVIEDGAFFKGSIDLHRETKVEPPRKAAAASVAASSQSSSIGINAAVTPQTSFLEPK
jgi:cytoskeletal protein CcmA (bactofilin family)